MILEGSCHCEAITFQFESLARYPYMRCYCQICRKTAGGGGYAINLKGLTDTLQVSGSDKLTEYIIAPEKLERKGRDGEVAKRFFCSICGSSLWANNSKWLQWIFPFASAIDTPLPVPPESAHIMLKYCPKWCRPEGENNMFDVYPNEGLEDWHRRLKLT